VKFWAGVLFGLMVMDPLPVHTVETVLRVVEVEPAVELVATPLADGLVDWVEADRQTDCLWEFLQASGVEITLQTVMAAGTWTDALGGACLLIGEEDE
jgi:hypothetical protein